jgi:peptide-methionine (S)-S-oxide reductase
MMRSLGLPLALVLLGACRPQPSAPPDVHTPATTSSAGAPMSAALVPTGADAVGVGPVGGDPGHAGAGTPLQPAPGHELAAFAEGCFWGSEDTFRHVPGVVATAVGYTGGHTANPTYEDVCTHTTGHAETVLVEFDPTRVTYVQLLRVFWESHDPTTLDRQGPDVGDQYRSAMFTFSADQAAAAEASKAQEQKSLSQKITTDIRAIGPFYKAEGYHQQYDEKTGRHSCPIPQRRSAI